MGLMGLVSGSLLGCHRLLSRLMGLMCLMRLVGNLVNLMSCLVGQMSLVRRLMCLVSRGLMLLRLVCCMSLLSLVRCVALVGISLVLKRLVLKGLMSRVRLVILMCLMSLMRHDGIVVHRLAHGLMLMCIHHRWRWLSRRSCPLPRLDDGAGHMGLGAPSWGVADISVDSRLVEKVMAVVALRRLLRSVGLLLIW